MRINVSVSGLGPKYDLCLAEVLKDCTTLMDPDNKKTQRI